MGWLLCIKFLKKLEWLERMIRKILFIRRDNIGDLICTTPAISAVRQAYPDVKIGILVNTYNAEVVMNNPDIDEIYVYQKAKHIPEKNKLIVWLNNIKILMKLREEKYDCAIACGTYSARLARYTYFSGAKLRIGYVSYNTSKSFFYNYAKIDSKNSLHEVERVFNLLEPLGIKGKPGKLKIYPSQFEIQNLKIFLEKISNKNKPLIAFHISSRKPENRWSSENFIDLARLIFNNYDVNILLLWSPGSKDNPFHPGDDEKAKIIIKNLPEIIPYKTINLKQLIAALNMASVVVCLDGGAMHIAAALGKPIVTIWGSTDPNRWRPWGVKHIILQDANKKAENVKVIDVFEATSTFIEDLLKNDT